MEKLQSNSALPVGAANVRLLIPCPRTNRPALVYWKKLRLLRLNGQRPREVLYHIFVSMQNDPIWLSIRFHKYSDNGCEGH